MGALAETSSRERESLFGCGVRFRVWGLGFRVGWKELATTSKGRFVERKGAIEVFSHVRLMLLAIPVCADRPVGSHVLSRLRNAQI